MITLDENDTEDCVYKKKNNNALRMKIIIFFFPSNISGELEVITKTHLWFCCYDCIRDEQAEVHHNIHWEMNDSGRPNFLKLCYHHYFSFPHNFWLGFAEPCAVLASRGGGGGGATGGEICDKTLCKVANVTDFPGCYVNGITLKSEIESLSELSVNQVV